MRSTRVQRFCPSLCNVLIKSSVGDLASNSISETSKKNTLRSTSESLGALHLDLGLENLSPFTVEGEAEHQEP